LAVVACVWLVGWLVGLALVCAFLCAFVSAFVCSFRCLFACVLSWVEIWKQQRTQHGHDRRSHFSLAVNHRAHRSPERSDADGAATAEAVEDVQKMMEKSSRATSGVAEWRRRIARWEHMRRSGRRRRWRGHLS
jgi:hypothetical protein